MKCVAVSNQRGGISLSIVLAVVLGLGLGASAYLNYYQHERSANERKLMQGEITDLRYELKKERGEVDATTAAATATPAPVATPEPSATPAPTPAATAAPAVAGASAQTMTVKTAANLRSKAAPSAPLVLSTKIPVGTKVTVTGSPVNGYTPVTVNSSAGYLLTSALSN